MEALLTLVAFCTGGVLMWAGLGLMALGVSWWVKGRPMVAVVRSVSRGVGCAAFGAVFVLAALVSV